MLPLEELSGADAANIDFLLTDIDDTLTAEGKLPAGSYQAIWDLHDAGVAVIAVTGRPAGWCDLIVRQWPVAAVVGENGAFALCMEGGTQVTLYHPAAPEPTANAQRLLTIAEQIFQAVPGTRLAKDQFFRRFDIAVDFREEPPYLSLAEAERIREIFAEHGAQAKISSIHVNAWFGSYDKRSMSSVLFRDRFGLAIDDARTNRRCIYCGDSPNDEPMFGAFVHSVGVANVAAFADSLRTPPAYITTAASAEGFVELAEYLLENRQ
jgi:HAD superfamily hydrolase (TIGR01484 family)